MQECNAGDTCQEMYVHVVLHMLRGEARIKLVEGPRKATGKFCHRQCRLIACLASCLIRILGCVEGLWTEPTSKEACSTILNTHVCQTVLRICRKLSGSLKAGKHLMATDQI